MIVGGLDCKYGFLALDSNLRWQSETEHLATLANMLCEPVFSEADGDPATYLLNKIQAKLGGNIHIAPRKRPAENVSPS